MTCLWITSVEIIDKTVVKNNWLKAKDYTNESDPRKYVLSLYYIITTATTVGYGDISPTNDVEIAFGIVFMIIGQVALTYAISMLGSIIATWDD